MRSMLQCAREIQRIRRELRPQIVHVHGLRSQLAVVASGHRPWVTRHGGGRMSGLPAHVAAARTLSTPLAPLLARKAFSVSPAPGGWTTILTASPNLRHLRLEPAQAMAPEPLFLWVGRLDVPKRPDVFVDAVAAAARSGPCRGVVVGTGPSSAELIRRAQAAGAPVEFVGHEADLRPWFAQAWAVCLFSEFEGLPFSVQEAMWSGRAVVATDLPGIRWFAGEDVLYADDVSTAAGALVRLMDRDEAIRLGRRAAAKVRDRVDVDAPFPQVEQLYLAAGARPTDLKVSPTSKS
jgi:glycosyltransferase involved in cell wall biosynthesis